MLPGNVAGSLQDRNLGQMGTSMDQVSPGLPTTLQVNSSTGSQITSGVPTSPPSMITGSGVNNPPFGECTYKEQAVERFRKF